MMQSHVLLWGNAYAQILKNSRGEVLQLIPLHPTKVKPKVSDSLEVYYEVALGPSKKEILPADEVFHLRGYRDSGLEGLSPVAAARQAIQAGCLLRVSERTSSMAVHSRWVCWNSTANTEP